MTGSVVIPRNRDLKHHLETVNVSYTRKLVSAQTASLKKRTVAFKEKDVYQWASFLDPKFKTQWCEDSEGVKKN